MSAIQQALAGGVGAVYPLSIGVLGGTSDMIRAIGMSGSTFVGTMSSTAPAVVFAVNVSTMTMLWSASFTGLAGTGGGSIGIGGGLVAIPGSVTGSGNDAALTICSLTGGPSVSVSRTQLAGASTDVIFSTCYSSSENCFYAAGYTLNGGVNKVLVVKFSTAGAVLWQKAVSVSEATSCVGRAICTDSSGNVYISAEVNSYTFSFLLKLDSGGNIGWARGAKYQNPSANTAVPSGVVCDPSGNVLHTIRATTGTYYQSFYLKYDSSGTRLWCSEIYDGGASQTARTFAVGSDSSGAFYVAGFASTNFYAKINSDASLGWIRSSSTDGVSAPFSLCTDSEYLYSPSNTKILKLKLSGDGATGNYTIPGGTFNYSTSMGTVYYASSAACDGVTVTPTGAAAGLTVTNPSVTYASAGLTLSSGPI